MGCGAALMPRSLTRHEILPVFAARIRATRLRRGITLVALATAANVHPVYLVHLENAQQSPGLEVLVRLAVALECSVAELVPLSPTSRARRSAATESR